MLDEDDRHDHTVFGAALVHKPCEPSERAGVFASNLGSVESPRYRLVAGLGW